MRANSIHSAIAKGLKNAEQILRILNTYPWIEEAFGATQFIKADQVEKQYSNWLDQKQYFEGIENESFKHYWLPIEKDAFKFFIDLSNEKLPLIETMYILKGMGKDEYKSAVIFESINQLLLMLDERQQLSQYLDKNLLEKNYDYLDEYDFGGEPF